MDNVPKQLCRKPFNVLLKIVGELKNLAQFCFIVVEKLVGLKEIRIDL